MKKLGLILVGGLILSIALIGCGIKTTNNKTDTSSINSYNNQSKQSGSMSQNKEVTSNKTQQSSEVKMDNSLKRKLNIFLSNFTEIGMQLFNKGKLSDAQEIDFAINHNYTNNSKLFISKSDNARIFSGTDERFSGSSVAISSQEIDKTIEKYFGVKVNKHRSITYGDLFSDVDNKTKSQLIYQYKDGYYFLPQYTGESLNFSQVQKLIDNGNNYFTVFFDNYSIYDTDNIDTNKDIYLPLESWTKAEKVSMNKAKPVKMKAEVKKEADGRYILIEYLNAQ